MQSRFLVTGAAALALIAFGALIAPPGLFHNDRPTAHSRELLSTSIDFGTSTSFPSDITDVNGWVHYGIVRKRHKKVDASMNQLLCPPEAFFPPILLHHSLICIVQYVGFIVAMFIISGITIGCCMCWGFCWYVRIAFLYFGTALASFLLYFLVLLHRFHTLPSCIQPGISSKPNIVSDLVPLKFVHGICFSPRTCTVENAAAALTLLTKAVVRSGHSCS